MSVIDTVRHIRKDLDIESRNNMLAVGIKSRPLPNNYTTESKSNFLSYRNRILSIPSHNIPRDHSIFLKTSRVNDERSEYRDKYLHNSLFLNNEFETLSPKADLRESIKPIGFVRKSWIKPSLTMQKSTVYKDSHRGFSVDNYQSKNINDEFKSLYFSNINHNIITGSNRKNERMSGNTVYKGDYLKPRRSTSYFVPRELFGQPKKATDCTTYLLDRVPNNGKYESAAASNTNYRSEFTDPHVRHCDCAVPRAPTPPQIQKRKDFIKDSISSARLDTTKRCSFRSIVRPKKAHFLN